MKKPRQSTLQNGPDKSDKDKQDDALTQETIDEYNKFRADRGLPPIGGIKMLRTIRISTPAHRGLIAIAASYGLLHDGKGNLSGLLEQIGLGNIRTLPPGVDVDYAALGRK
jgi:hypothetical protein